MLRWYLATYKRDRSTAKVVRYCAMNDDIPRIKGAGATVFQDVEVLGNYGLVAIDAPAPVHDSLSSPYIQLPNLDFTGKLRDTLNERERREMGDILLQVGYQEVEIRERLGTRDLALDQVRFSSYLNMLRTRRVKPRYDVETDTIKFDGPSRPTNPLPINPLAFGGMPILDNFNRANENPLGNGLWSGPLWVGNLQGRIISNQVTSTVSGYGGSYINTGTYGPDTAISMSLPIAASGAVDLYARLINPGVANTMDGYHAEFKSSNSTVGIYIIDDQISTLLGSTFSQAIQDNDQVGFELIGSNLRAWIHEGSSWVEVGLRTDGTYTAAGNIGFDVSNSTIRIDDFAGETLSMGGSAPVLTVPGAQTAKYDALKAITGISASDPETDIDEWQLSCSAGMVMAVTLSGGVAVASGNNNSAAMTLQGTQAALNTVMATLKVSRVDPGVLVWDIVNSITLIVRDADENSDSDTIQVTWTPTSGLTTSSVELTGTPTQIIDMLTKSIGITPQAGFTGQLNMGMHAVTGLFTALDIVELTVLGLFVAEPHPVPTSAVKVYIGK